MSPEAMRVRAVAHRLADMLSAGRLLSQASVERLVLDIFELASIGEALDDLAEASRPLSARELAGMGLRHRQRRPARAAATR